MICSIAPFLLPAKPVDVDTLVFNPITHSVQASNSGSMERGERRYRHFISTPVADMVPLWWNIVGVCK